MEAGVVRQVISLREERRLRTWVDRSALPDAKEICETHREQVLHGDLKVTDGFEKMHFSVLHVLWFIVFLSESGLPYSLSRPSPPFSSSAHKPTYALTCPTSREGTHHDTHFFISSHVSSAFDSDSTRGLRG